MTQALPPASRLLHIGPHKTGTTALQAAFHQSREALRRQGVHYAPNTAHPMRAVLAAGTAAPDSDAPLTFGQQRWAALTRAVRSSDARAVVVSSEFFADASPERISAVVADLDPERIQVVVTLRPLVRILASQWQQYMQNRPGVRYDDALDYEGWLHAVLERPDDVSITPSFWLRHRHDELVRRWSAVVGRERVVVVAVDDSDRNMLLRSFEELLALQPQTLVPTTERTNRSLTLPEVEMLREFNRGYLEQGWSLDDYTELVRFGAVRFLQQRQPPADEPRIVTPRWAADRAVEVSKQMVADIADLGVRVVGSLSTLTAPAPAKDVGDHPRELPIPPEVPARFMAGLVKQLAQLPAWEAPPDRATGDIERAIRRDKLERAALRESAATEARIHELNTQLERLRSVDEATRTELLRALLGRLRHRWSRAGRGGGPR